MADQTVQDNTSSVDPARGGGETNHSRVDQPSQSQQQQPVYYRPLLQSMRFTARHSDVVPLTKGWLEAAGLSTDNILDIDYRVEMRNGTPHIIANFFLDCDDDEVLRQPAQTVPVTNLAASSGHHQGSGDQGGQSGSSHQTDPAPQTSRHHQAARGDRGGRGGNAPRRSHGHAAPSMAELDADLDRYFGRDTTN